MKNRLPILAVFFIIAGLMGILFFSLNSNHKKVEKGKQKQAQLHQVKPDRVQKIQTHKEARQVKLSSPGLSFNSSEKIKQEKPYKTMFKGHFSPRRNGIKRMMKEKNTIILKEIRRN